MANGALESMDRKAAFVPTTLGVVAGVLIGGGDSFSAWQTVFLVAAMPLSLQQTNAIAALAAQLYDYLPGSSPWGSYTFATAAAQRGSSSIGRAAASYRRSPKAS